MGKKQNEAPKHIKLSASETDALMKRISNSELPQKDIKVLLGLLSFNFWLQERLSRAKLTIKRLRNLFGFNTEKKTKKNKPSDADDKGDTEDPPADENNEAPPADPPASNATENKAASQWDDSKNHGRNGAKDYPGCPTIDIEFEDEKLKEGKCPRCAECNTDANIYSVDPCVLIFLDSQPLISGERYQFQKGRCNVCETYFTAPVPNELVDRPKYTASCYTSIAIHHYYAGLPFKRLETLQAAQGIPLPDSTQYDLMDELYQRVIEPVVDSLRACAANGTNLYFDDTPGRIIEQTLKNKLALRPQDKKGIHATALLSEYRGHRIYLFDTNTDTAGKQLKSLFSQRTIDKEFVTMSDASSSNFPMLNETLLARWVISLCLTHGRRKFFELLGNEEDDDIAFVIELIAKVYQHERHCKEEELTDEKRLDYHQKQSEPIMSAMKTWFNNLLLYKQVEPNSRLGEAISYMLKRWHWLTQFLKVPGAALDNNICELAIKVLIRYRKNALFYRTFYGACIGDAMMSILHTAAHAGVNIFDYLNTLQEQADLVQENPESWLPWCYQETMAAQTARLPMAVNSS